MHDFLKKHQESVLIVAMVFLLAVLIWFYVWGINLLVRHVTQAFQMKTEKAQVVNFNLEDAARINMRRLTP